MCQTIDIPWKDKICQKIGDKAVQKIDKLIDEHDHLIDPEHCCQAIHIC